jgi:hypothetical protein
MQHRPYLTASRNNVECGSTTQILFFLKNTHTHINTLLFFMKKIYGKYLSGNKLYAKKKSETPCQRTLEIKRIKRSIFLFLHFCFLYRVEVTPISPSSNEYPYIDDPRPQ